MNLLLVYKGDSMATRQDQKFPPYDDGTMAAEVTMESIRLKLRRRTQQAPTHRNRAHQSNRANRVAILAPRSPAISLNILSNIGSKSSLPVATWSKKWK